MTGRITGRTILVSALLVGQLVCLLAALLWFGAWLESGLGQLVTQRTLTDSQQQATQFVKTLTRLNLNDVTPGSPDQQRLQQLVDDTKLPADGAMLVLSDQTQQVLAKQDRIDTGWTFYTPYHTSSPVPLPDDTGQASSDEGAFAPWVKLSDGSYELNTIELPHLDARLVLIQPAGPMRSAVRAYVVKVRTIGTIVVVVAVIISALVTLVIAQRYESRLQQINRGLESQVARRSAALLRSRDAVIFGLAKLAESRDGETGEHLERIAKYTEVLARQISYKLTPGGNEDWVETLAGTAVLHDIGKVGIPDAVLRKPASLTDEERRTVERHPFIGGDTLLEIKRRWGEDPFLTTASQVCLGHHEWWDGSGYPFKLKGEDIPLAARIVSLADVYDALTSERAYKDAMPHERARQMIAENSGTQFDPMVVQAFMEVEGEFKRIAQKYPVMSPHDPVPPGSKGPSEHSQPADPGVHRQPSGL